MKKDKFWTFNLSHLLTLVVWAATVFVLYGKLARTIEQHEQQINVISQGQLEVMSKRLPEINEKLATCVNDVAWIRRYIETKIIQTAGDPRSEHNIAPSK